MTGGLESCDVLVVGGGPAGSSCAWALRESGLDVLVWDGREFPRDKVCAGWITPQVLEDLEIDPNEYARERTFQPISGFRIARMGDAEASIDYPAPVSYGIRRCEFDHFLLKRSGARLRLGEPVRQIRREGSEWTVNGTVRASALIGAGGHFCPVARFLRLRLCHGGREPVVAACEVEKRLSAEERGACRVAPERPELYFTRDLKGYGWVFRKGDFLNIGLGRQDPERLPNHVRAFVAFLEHRERIPPGMDLDWRGHAYLLYGEADRPLVDDGVLVIGDAAGIAYPRSGEGIRPAIESGLLAGAALRLAAGRYGRDQLDGYGRALEKRFGPRNGGRTLDLARLLPERLAHAIAGRLLSTSWFSRRVVLDHWFFHSDQPALKPLEESSTRPSLILAADRFRG